jgi:hypothetical protein
VWAHVWTTGEDDPVSKQDQGFRLRLLCTTSRMPDATLTPGKYTQ